MTHAAATNRPVEVRSVYWTEALPWLIIFRTLRISAAISIILIGSIGAVLTAVGWNISEAVFIRNSARESSIEFAHAAESQRSPYRSFYTTGGRTAAENGRSPNAWMTPTRLNLGVGEVAQRIAFPFREVFSFQNSIGRFCYYFFGAAWILVVWSVCGAAISRIALMRIARDESVDFFEAIRFGVNKLADCCAAVGVPLVAAALLCLPISILGFVASLSLGAALIGLIWFVVLALAGVAMVILFGELFAWPFQIAAISAEDCDGFDGMSRGYSVVVQRPANLLFYALLAVAFSIVCWILAEAVSNGVIYLAYWAMSWGVVGPDQRNLLISNTVPEGTEVSAMLSSARAMMGFWDALVRTIGAGFLYGLFWTQAAAVYLLLRKDLDQREMDEIAMIDPPFADRLPDLQRDVDESNSGAESSAPKQRPATEQSPSEQSANREHMPVAGSESVESSSNSGAADADPSQSSSGDTAKTDTGTVEGDGHSRNQPRE